MVAQRNKVQWRVFFAFGLLSACGAAEPAIVPPVQVPDSGNTVLDGGAPDAMLPADAAVVDASPLLCPAGLRLVRDLRMCAGGQAAPASLRDAMQSAMPGDTVSLGTVSTPSLPCLPALACAAVGTNARTLIFSDDPEDVSADGILYQDTLKKGVPYRVYVYHANGSAAPRKFSVVLSNTQTVAATLQVQREATANPSGAYLAIGKQVAVAYMNARPAASRLVRVPSSGRVVLDAALENPVANKQLIHGIYDVVTDVDVTLSVVSVASADSAVSRLPTLSVLPFDGKHDRGTFPEADVTLVLSPFDGLMRRIRLGDGIVLEDSKGTDATRSVNATLRGNFGALYTVSGSAGPVTLGVSARGGAWTGALLRGTTAVALPSSSAALLAPNVAVSLGTLSSEDLTFMTGGSASLPIDLFAVAP
jgi:hypothetical protein